MSCVFAHSLIYWTEIQSHGKGRLLRCRPDGSGLRTVLRRQRRGSRQPRSDESWSCSCREFSVASSFAVDSTRPATRPHIYAADSDTGDIWLIDDDGCQCRLVVNATALWRTPSDIGLCTLLCSSAVHYNS